MTRSEFEHIATALRQKVLKVCLDFWRSKEDAEDAAQETMVQLWRYCEHIDAERNVAALAVRVAKNCCVSMYRKQGNAEYVSEAAANSSLFTLHSSLSPEMRLEAEDTQKMLEETVALLKPRERQLFEMRQIEGLSTEEVSQQTGIPKPSITAMVSAARKKVYMELKRRMKQ